MKRLCFLGALFFIGCSSIPSTPPETSAGKETSHAMESFLYVGSVDGPMLPGANVYISTEEGLERIGRTDGLGVMPLPVHRLVQENPELLVICLEYFFCGAIRLRKDGAPIRDEYFIQLAPFAMR